LIAAAVAGFALAAIFWTLIGYPLWLAIRARRGRPVRKAPFECDVTAIVPVRNGGPWVADKIRSVLAQDWPEERLKILLLDDGSTDDTYAQAEPFLGPRVEILRLPRGGKAVALTRAFERATGDLLLLTDVRQALAPDCLRRLVENFADPQVGVVSGELEIRRGVSAETAQIGLYWRYETAIRDNLGKIDSMLGATGPIYAIRRSLARPVPSSTILDDVYLPMRALLDGYRLVMEPRAKAYDFPTELKSEFRRKVRTQAGIYQLLWLLPELLGPRNRMLGAWVSLKFGRLLLPWMLLALAISSFFLPSPWREALLVAQALGYGLALLDPATPEGSVLKRLTSPLRTFVTLILAAAAAVRIFWVPPADLWKETRVGKTA